jgi:hypothetical protein
MALHTTTNTGVAHGVGTATASPFSWVYKTAWFLAYCERYLRGGYQSSIFFSFYAVS